MGPSKNLALKTSLRTIFRNILLQDHTEKVKFSFFVVFFCHPWLLRKVQFLYNRWVDVVVPNKNLALKNQLGPIFRNIFVLRSYLNNEKFWFWARFWPPRLLIKVRLLYNRCANFMTPSENLAIFFIINVPLLETFL